MAIGLFQAPSKKMQRRLGPVRRAGVTSFFVLLACVGGYYLGGLGAAGLTQRSAPPQLLLVNGLGIDSKVLDLGEVWETPNYVLTLQVENVSNEFRSIVDWSGSCGCLRVEPQRLAIAPGQTAELSLTIDLTHRLPYQLGSAQWPVSVKFNPVFEGDFASTPGWELKGVVHSRLSLESIQIPLPISAFMAAVR